MRPVMRRLAIVSLALAAGCSDDVPDQPSWAADVQPILVANCARCHSVPVQGGAPSGFRLDVYGPTFTDGGDFVLGAGAMAEFIAVRVHAETMPPRFPLTGRQQEVLVRWAELAEPGLAAPEGAPDPDNRAPSMALEGDLAADDTGRVTIAYRIDDPDLDVVTGELAAVAGDERVRITRELHTGRGEAVWDTGALPAGTYNIVASVDDGSGEVEIALGSYEVSHPGGNTAPSLRFLSNPTDALFSDADGALTVDLEVVDLDGDPVELRVEAVRGDEAVLLFEGPAAPPGEETAVPVSFADVPAGDRWRIRVTADDGNTEPRTLESLPFAVGHGTTDLRWADVEPIFARSCMPCHGAISRAPGIGFDLREHGGSDDEIGVYDYRGLVYRRAVVERTMPPQSAALLLSENALLSAEDRELLREWLLAGAPE